MEIRIREAIEIRIREAMEIRIREAMEIRKRGPRTINRDEATYMLSHTWMPDCRGRAINLTAGEAHLEKTIIHRPDQLMLGGGSSSCGGRSLRRPGFSGKICGLLERLITQLYLKGPPGGADPGIAAPPLCDLTTRHK